MKQCNHETIRAVILAAGKGTRLQDGEKPSAIPKVLYPLAGKPMVSYILATLKKMGLKKPIMVVGYQAELVKKEFGQAASYVFQQEQLGTAQAALLGIKKLPVSLKTVLILNGDDSAFYRPETLRQFISDHRKKGATASVLMVRGDFQGLGRVVRDQQGNIVKIVEKEYLTPGYGKIREFNAGTYCFDAAWAKQNIPKIKKSIKGEYFLPDAISLAIQQGKKVIGTTVSSREWLGVNTVGELRQADQAMAERLARD